MGQRGGHTTFLYSLHYEQMGRTPTLFGESCALEFVLLIYYGQSYLIKKKTKEQQE